MTGLVKGLAERFGDEVAVEHFRDGTGDDEHDAFRVIYVRADGGEAAS